MKVSFCDSDICGYAFYLMPCTAVAHESSFWTYLAVNTDEQVEAAWPKRYANYFMIMSLSTWTPQILRYSLSIIPIHNNIIPLVITLHSHLSGPPDPLLTIIALRIVPISVLLAFVEREL